MDLTICIMLPPRGAADYTQSANPKYRVCAPVAIYEYKGTPTEITAPNTGAVHVTDVPTRPAWAGLTTEQIIARLNSKFCAPRMDAGGVEVIERRLWCGIASAIPAGARNTLRTVRQITVTWAQFKNFLQHLDEQRTLTDADID